MMLFLRQSLQLFAALFLALSSAAGISQDVHRPAKRSYSIFDYYVLEHDPTTDVSVDDCAAALGAEVLEQVGELANHWVLRVPKAEPDLNDKVLRVYSGLESSTTIDKRHSIQRAVKKVFKQTLKQRVKRAAIPAPPVNSDTDSDAVARSREVAARLGIEDPLFKDQWHIINEDFPEHMVNATPVWDLGITGKGVTACLVDDGLDYTSEDLKGNFDAAGSYDFNDHEDLPTPKLQDDHHGTRCAGEIAAVKNGVCGVGIAYDSQISGVRILSGPVTDVDEAAALNYAYQSNDIYSCSWGPPDDGRSMDAPSLLIEKAILNGIQKGRGGKGSVFVFASGNGGSHGDQCNFDGYTNSIYSVTVASIDYKGEHPPYSEACAANLVTTYSSGTNPNKAIVTTDVGTNKCTRSHGGTSAAAPNAVGIFALALSVRPDLSWRDIQHLCIKTAQVVNPGDESWELTSTGQPYSYKFGFGKLDAFNFVLAAQNWKNVKPQAWLESPPIQLGNGIYSMQDKFSGGVSIGRDGVESSFEITSELLSENNFEILEHVTVRIWIQHTRRGHVDVSLLSPNGIRSMLAEKRPADLAEDGFAGWRFMTVKHWGEYPVGSWTLKVSDEDVEGESGRFIGWSLSLWGSAQDANKSKLYSLRNSDELPIPFPPPIEDISSDPELTSVAPSTTKSYVKPTIVVSTSVVSGVAPTTGTSSPSSDTLKGMSDRTRYMIAAAGSIAFILMLAGGIYLIVRRIRQNRRDAALRTEGRETDFEEVNMRLLDHDRSHVVVDEDDEASERDDHEESSLRASREHPANLETNAAMFQSEFLRDEEGSDHEENLWAKQQPP